MAKITAAYIVETDFINPDTSFRDYMVIENNSTDFNIVVNSIKCETKDKGGCEYEVWRVSSWDGTGTTLTPQRLNDRRMSAMFSIGDIKVRYNPTSVTESDKLATFANLNLNGSSKAMFLYKILLEPSDIIVIKAKEYSDDPDLNVTATFSVSSIRS